MIKIARQNRKSASGRSVITFTACINGQLYDVVEIGRDYRRMMKPRYAKKMIKANACARLAFNY